MYSDCDANITDMPKPVLSPTQKNIHAGRDMQHTHTLTQVQPGGARA